jgi:hypothetical protein
MSASAINRELDRLDAARSANALAFIAANRGHERPSEYLSLNDPLSAKARQIYERESALRGEIERRCGSPAPVRLPRGVGPVRV